MSLVAAPEPRLKPLPPVAARIDAELVKIDCELDWLLALEAALSRLQADLEAAELERSISEDAIDVTLPGTPRAPAGSRGKRWSCCATCPPRPPRCGSAPCASCSA